MAELKPRKMSLTEINNGREFTDDDGINPSWATNVFESTAYSQRQMEIFVDEFDASQVDNTGTPIFELIPFQENGTTYKKIRVANLKGDKGLDGAGINPNLLINGDFRVNQRKEASYIGSTSLPKYTVDRWKVYGNTSVTPTNTLYGIKLQKVQAESYVTFFQAIEAGVIVGGETLTVSASVDGVIYSNTFIVSSMSVVSTPISNFGSLDFIYDSNGSCSVVFAFSQNDTTPHYINWVKLEFGGVATSFIPTLYSEEILKCMRYYQIRSNSYTIETNAIDRPIPMRVNGTIGTTTIDGTTYNYADAEIY